MVRGLPGDTLRKPESLHAWGNEATPEWRFARQSAPNAQINRADL